MTVKDTSTAAGIEKKRDLISPSELSEEDMQLKEKLDMLVERLKENERALHRPALESLREIMRSATTSMTSVPKPLKFLRERLAELEHVYEGMSNDSTKNFMADVLSALSMTTACDSVDGAEDRKYNVLKYRLLSGGGQQEPAENWGHEYVKHLAMEIADEFSIREDREVPTDDLVALSITDLVPFFLKHNSEADACDLLYEIKKLDKIVEFVTKTNYERISLYLTSCVNYEPYPDNVELLKVIHKIYTKMNRHSLALIQAIRLNDSQMIVSDFRHCRESSSTSNSLLHYQQLCYILAKYGIVPDALLAIGGGHTLDTSSKGDQSSVQSPASDVIVGDACFEDILRKTNFSKHYLFCAKEFSVEEPRSPEEIYKSHLDTRNTDAPDFPKVITSSAVVNGFVNYGFCKDRYLVTGNGGSEPGSLTLADTWIFKGKNESILCAVASIGVLFAGNIDDGLASIDRYLSSDDQFVRAGSLLGIGLICSPGIKNESDPALALLTDFVDSPTRIIKESSIVGLMLAYGGSRRQEVADLLLPLLVDTGLDVSVVALASLALGHVFVGSCNGEITSVVLQMLMEREEEFKGSPFARFMALSLGLLYLGKQEASDAAIEAIRVLSDDMAKACSALVSVCAYAGTGNVLQIQQLLYNCSTASIPIAINSDDKSESPLITEINQMSTDDKDQSAPPSATTTPAAAATDKASSKKTEDHDRDRDLYQTFSVLGIALIALGEDIGSEMAFRLFNHLMFYGESAVRKAVPLALALISASNPQMKVIDVLGKYSHDGDKEVAINAVLALGLVGCGTNNSRVANLLRGLANFYYKDGVLLSVVKLAQGILHAGKGILTINPLSFNKTVLNPVVLSSMLSFCVSFTSSEKTVLGKYPHLLYLLCGAFQPRYFMTLDESGEPLKVPVRVGQAVDIVGQAGKPRTISGFQTQTTPVLLGITERAELTNDEYVAMSEVLEGIVLLKKNPNYSPDS